MEDLDFRFMNKIQVITEMEKNQKKLNDTIKDMEALIQTNRELQVEQDHKLDLKIQHHGKRIDELELIVDQIEPIQVEIAKLEDSMKQKEEAGADVDFAKVCSREEYE